jgi:hypothetical protein
MQIRAQSGLRWAWAFAILWNLIAAPATLFGAAPAIRRGPGPAWVALVFPIAGVALLLWAVQLTLRVRRFGTSLFDLAGEGAVIGGPLRGTITAKNLPGDTTVRLTLTCINRVVTGSGKNRSVSEKIVWQDEQTVPPHALLAGPQGPIVPVAFALPNGAPPTREADPDDTILWRLQAAAVLPGVDYGGQFEVPVAGGGTNPGADNGGHDALSVALPAEAPPRPEASRVLVEPLPEGGACYVLPAWRNPGAAIGLGAFTLIFGAVPAAIISFIPSKSPGSIFWIVPFFFAVVFLGFALLLALLTLCIGFLSTRVTATPERLVIACRLLGASWARTIPSLDVRELRLRVRMQAGTTPYYDLIVETASGARATVGAMLRDRREAEWLAGAIKCSLSR